jgi:hypothetical protein
MVVSGTIKLSKLVSFMEPGFELPITVPPRKSRDRLRALHRQLRAAILEGRLQPGLRLPPTRVFAATYGVSRNTAIASCASKTQHNLRELLPWLHENCEVWLKLKLFLEEARIAYRVVPMSLSRSDQFKPEFLAIAILSPLHPPDRCANHPSIGNRPAQSAAADRRALAWRQRR